MAKAKEQKVDPIASIEAKLDAAMSAGSTTQNFIGLGPGDTGMESGDTTRPGQQAGLKPRYYNGAEQMPNRDNWEPIQKRRLQDMLVTAGLLDEDYQDGVWDQPSANAFANVLALANNTPGSPDWSTALESYMRSTPIDAATGKPKVRGSKSKAERQPLVLRFTDPNDIAATVNDVAQKRLGRRFSQDEMNKFVTNYQRMERGAQVSEYDQGQTGGSYTAAPSVEVAANRAAEEADPVAAQARNMLPLVKSVSDMLNSRTFDTAQPMQGSV